MEDCTIFIGELTGGGLASFVANAAARGSAYQEIRILGNDGMLRAVSRSSKARLDDRRALGRTGQWRYSTSTHS